MKVAQRLREKGPEVEITKYYLKRLKSKNKI